MHVPQSTKTTKQNSSSQANGKSHHKAKFHAIETARTLLSLTVVAVSARRWSRHVDRVPKMS
jgi:hypothetical protein